MNCMIQKLNSQKGKNQICIFGWCCHKQINCDYLVEGPPAIGTNYYPDTDIFKNLYKNNFFHYFFFIYAIHTNEQLLRRCFAEVFHCNVFCMWSLGFYSVLICKYVKHMTCTKIK